MSKAEREAQIYSRLDGTTFPLERYSLAELRGITLFYNMNIGNLGNKRKSDLIKAIGANVKYKARIRRSEQRQIAAQTLEERREEKKRQVIEAREQREIEQELQTRQTIGDAVMEKGLRTPDTDIDWYAEELRAELSFVDAKIDTDDIKMGDFLFFDYDARFPERYEYWDKRPLAFMLGLIDDNKILGYNVHYLNPDYRDTISESLLNNTAIDASSLPKKGLHSYIIGNMINIYRIPANPGEYRDIAKLVTEDFVRRDTGFSVDLQTVWDDTTNN
tara:strand:- start:1186 stop:2010 length:825 start_codon:yes stop_codon:yes gene_type:complete